MEQVIGERGRKFMKKQTHIKYTDEKLGKVKVISDFLPLPDQLVQKEETVKVTLSLSKASVDYFKILAKKNHTQYQKMIRSLIDKYAAHYSSHQ